MKWENSSPKRFLRMKWNKLSGYIVITVYRAFVLLQAKCYTTAVFSIILTSTLVFCADFVSNGFRPRGCVQFGMLLVVFLSRRSPMLPNLCGMSCISFSIAITSMSMVPMVFTEAVVMMTYAMVWTCSFWNNDEIWVSVSSTSLSSCTRVIVLNALSHTTFGLKSFSMEFMNMPSVHFLSWTSFCNSPNTRLSYPRARIAFGLCSMLMLQMQCSASWHCLSFHSFPRNEDHDNSKTFDNFTCNTCNRENNGDTRSLGPACTADRSYSISRDRRRE